MRITKIRPSKFIIWGVKKNNWASYLNLFHFIKKAVFFNYYQHETVFQVLEKCSTCWDCWVVWGLPRNKSLNYFVTARLSYFPCRFFSGIVVIDNDLQKFVCDYCNNKPLNSMFQIEQVFTSNCKTNSIFLSEPLFFKESKTFLFPIKI